MARYLKILLIFSLAVIPFFSLRAASLSDRLKGRILLQVEQKGQAWYVDPKTGLRYYLANGNAAYSVMRYLGVGITNKNLELLKNNKSLALKQSGKIFLQVQEHGEAYYVDFKGNLHYLKDGATAYKLMSSLGLGITDKNLQTITVNTLPNINPPLRPIAQNPGGSSSGAGGTINNPSGGGGGSSSSGGSSGGGGGGGSSNNSGSGGGGSSPGGSSPSGGGSSGGGTSSSTSPTPTPTPTPTPSQPGGEYYLIHDQKFVIPDNALKGDIVGSLANFWNTWYGKLVSYSIVNSDGIFSIDNSGQITVANNTSLAGKKEIALIVRAVNGKTKKSSDANLKIQILSSANTYFIDPSVSANGNGSRSNPFSSWKNVSIVAGNNYLQKRGTTDNISGIKIIGKNNVIIGAYGSATARPLIVSENSGHIIDVVSDNVTVRDLDIEAKLSISGVKFSAPGSVDSRGNIVDDCRVLNSEWGIRVFNNNGLTVLNSEIAFTGDDGMYIQDSPNMQIGYNYIHDANQKYLTNSIWCQRDHSNNPSVCPSESYSGGDGMQLATNSGRTINGFNIHDNIIDQSRTDNKFCIITVGVSGGQDHGFIENNYCKRAAGKNNIGYYTQNDVGDTIRYNTFENSGIFAHSSAMTIAYNLFKQGNTLNLFRDPSLTGQTSNIYNNVFYNTLSVPHSTFSSSDGVVIDLDDNESYNIKNNIFYQTVSSLKSVYIGGTKVSYQKNIYYPFISTNDSRRDTSALVADPLFVDHAVGDFSLQSSSPAISLGTIDVNK